MVYLPGKAIKDFGKERVKIRRVPDENNTRHADNVVEFPPRRGLPLLKREVMEANLRRSIIDRLYEAAETFEVHSNRIREFFPEIAQLEKLEIETVEAKRLDPIPTEAPVLWINAKDGRTPPQFIMDHYGAWVGKGLTRADIRNLDRGLYNALYNWEQRKKRGELAPGREKLPIGYELPTIKEQNDSWVKRVKKSDETDLSSNDQRYKILSETDEAKGQTERLKKLRSQSILKS